jgi:iron complex transport system substrate-binding protein
MAAHEMLDAAPRFPQRIACLTEETVEVLYRIGAGDLVVGVSAFTVRPAEAKAKPRVSSFLDVNLDKLKSLSPDLVLGFSDLQADIARLLAKEGIPVVIFNQRSVAEILQAVRMTGALVGKQTEACALADELEQHVRDVAASPIKKRPRVFFEEWPDPLISGIRWVSELVEIAGGDDVCKETRSRHDAKGRTFDPQDVLRRDPDVVLASWCGKPVDPDVIRARFPRAQIHEIDPAIILQPGPAALTDGLDVIARILREWADVQSV